MPDFPIPDVSGWPQALVVLGILAYLAWKAWLDSGRTKETNTKVTALEATLTTTNGGSHVKDQLNRIEDKVDGVDTRVTALEGIPRAVAVTVHPVEIEKGTES